MLLNADYILPVELTGYVRAALGDLTVNRFTLSRWLPNRMIDEATIRYRFVAGLLRWTGLKTVQTSR